MKQHTAVILRRTIPAVAAFYFVHRVSWLYRHVRGGSVLSRLSVTFGNLSLTFPGGISMHPSDLLAGVLAAGAVVLLLLLARAGKGKKYRPGLEYGSARWGTPEDIAPFVDEQEDQNLLLTATEKITMNSRPKRPELGRNKNVAVIGGSGSGKTRFFVKPNLMQLHSSYVITDPKGTLIRECGDLLRKNGYRILVFNTVNPAESMHYNPFAYIHSEKDILKLTNVLIANTKTEGERGADGFWEKAERLLYSAVIGYIWYEAVPEEQNMQTLLDILNACDASEADEKHVNAVDLMFQALEKEKPEHFAVRQYNRYKQAAGKTAKSILVSCGARLSPFDIQALRDLMSEDEMDLASLGDRKTALFIIISDTDTTFNFVVAMLYTQLFNELCEKADKSKGGRLKYHVRLLLDEFANIGKIPNFDKLIATIRSREISASVILQSASQLKTMYRDSAETILGNCDSHLFLGGKEESTLKQISESLGKETIDLVNTSRNRGSSASYGTSFQKTGKELMTRDELAVLPGDECILQLRGVRPFRSKKYDLTSHPRYRLLPEATGAAEFDVAGYIRSSRDHKLTLGMEEPFVTVETSVGGENQTGP